MKQGQPLNYQKYYLVGGETGDIITISCNEFNKIKKITFDFGKLLLKN